MNLSVRIQKGGQAVIPAKVIRQIGGEPGKNLRIELNSDYAMLRAEKVSEEPHSFYTREIPSNKSIQDFLDEYEKKHQMTSDEFWQKYKAGELECNVEFVDWAGHYEHKMYLESIGVDPKSVTFEEVLLEGKDEANAR